MKGLAFGVLLAVACASEVAMAAVIQPSGLSPGQQYQIVFVTIGLYLGNRSDIEYYNEMVSLEAAAAVELGLPAGVSWHAIVSTETVSANQNAPSNGLPVYNTAGQLVAASTLYGGSLINPVTYNAAGGGYGVENAVVRTGSDPFGNGIPGLTMGGPGEFTVGGSVSAATSGWMNAYQQLGLGGMAAIYALSDPITYVPEPATLSLVVSGLAVVAFVGVARFLR